MGSKKWRNEELDILRAIFVEKGIKTAKEALPDRTEMAILLKAAELRLFRRPKGYVRVPWLNDEISFLKEHYATSTWKHLMMNLAKHSREAIKLKGQSLGLRRYVATWAGDGFKEAKLIETDKAYIAGLFDGEGTVRLKGNGVEFSICNTDLIALKEVSSILEMGGIKNYLYISRKKPPRQPIGALRLNTHQDIHAILHAMFPYLKIKRARSAEVIKFIETKAGLPKNSTERLRMMGYP